MLYLISDISVIETLSVTLTPLLCLNRNRSYSVIYGVLETNITCSLSQGWPCLTHAQTRLLSPTLTRCHWIHQQHRPRSPREHGMCDFLILFAFFVRNDSDSSCRESLKKRNQARFQWFDQCDFEIFRCRHRYEFKFFSPQNFSHFNRRNLLDWQVKCLSLKSYRVKMLHIRVLKHAWSVTI